MSDHDDPFRYCVHCAADCYQDDPEHAVDCPTNTGIWPVREQDMGPKCTHCGERAFGPMHCMDCGAALRLGDHYMHRTVDEGEPLSPGIESAPIFEVICVGCAAREAMTT